MPRGLSTKALPFLQAVAAIVFFFFRSRPFARRSFVIPLVKLHGFLWADGNTLFSQFPNIHHSAVVDEAFHWQMSFA